MHSLSWSFVCKAFHEGCPSCSAYHVQTGSVWQGQQVRVFFFPCSGINLPELEDRDRADLSAFLQSRSSKTDGITFEVERR